MLCQKNELHFPSLAGLFLLAGYGKERSRCCCTKVRSECCCVLRSRTSLACCWQTCTACRAWRGDQS